LVEEWGCNLGEDAFLTEEVIDFPRKDEDSQQDVGHDLDNAGGDLEALMDDLQKEWTDPNMLVFETDKHAFLLLNENKAPIQK